MIDHETGEISELESKLLMLYGEGEYQILFDDLAYIVFEPNDISLYKRAGYIVDSNGNKITETIFDNAIPIKNKKNILGYCLLMPEILAAYTDMFYENINGQYKLKDVAPVCLNVPIIKSDLTIEKAKIYICRWKPTIPELRLKYRFKSYRSSIDTDRGIIESFK